MKSRIVQAILLIILFCLGVASCSTLRESGPAEVSNEGYVPPSP